MIVKGVQFSQFGGPEVLEIVELPDPEPAAGQIRIAVRAVGINPVDWKIRSGAMGGGDFPRRTGIDVAGIVDRVGDGVAGVAPGASVFGFAVGGGAAELTLMEHWAPLPSSLDFIHAAALPVAVETATRVLDLLGVGAGHTLLINGASGVVGRAAVQLARERGARVIGTAGPGNQDLVRSVGAEPTTYGDGLQERVRALAPAGVDRAFDAAGGGALPALVELAGGADHVVTIADYEGAQETGVQFTGGTSAWHALTDIGSLIDAGRFSIPVARTFPLAAIADAHRLSETGHPGGKIVLTVP